MFNKGIEKVRRNSQRLPRGEQSLLLEVVGGCTGCNSSALCCLFSKKSDRSCKLFFIGNTLILGSNRSIQRYGRDERAVGNEEGLHLVTLGDGLTRYFVIILNIFLNGPKWVATSLSTLPKPFPPPLSPLIKLTSVALTQ